MATRLYRDTPARTPESAAADGQASHLGYRRYLDIRRDPPERLHLAVTATTISSSYTAVFLL